jgi:hypothetical protein
MPAAGRRCCLLAAPRGRRGFRKRFPAEDWRGLFRFVRRRRVFVWSGRGGGLGFGGFVEFEKCRGAEEFDHGLQGPILEGAFVPARFLIGGFGEIELQFRIDAGHEGGLVHARAFAIEEVTGQAFFMTEGKDLFLLVGGGAGHDLRRDAVPEERRSIGETNLGGGKAEG